MNVDSKTFKGMGTVVLAGCTYYAISRQQNTISFPSINLDVLGVTLVIVAVVVCLLLWRHGDDISDGI